MSEITEASSVLVTAGQVAARYSLLDQNGFPSAELARLDARRGRIPPPVRLPGGRAIRWRLSDLQAWEALLKPIHPSKGGHRRPKLGGAKRGRPSKADQVARRRAFEFRTQQAQQQTEKN